MSYEGQDDLITLSLEPRASPARPTPIPTPQETARAVISASLLFLGYPIAFVTALLAVITLLSSYWTHRQFAQWPHITAEVNSCEVYETDVTTAEWKHNGPTPHQSSFYGFRCDVAYTAHSRAESAVADVGYQTSDRGEMWVQWSNRIHRGDHIEIIYDPSDSTRARLAGDLVTTYAPALHTLKTAVWVGLIAFLMIALGRKLRPRSADDPTSQPGTAAIMDGLR